MVKSKGRPAGKKKKQKAPGGKRIAGVTVAEMNAVSEKKITDYTLQDILIHPSDKPIPEEWHKGTSHIVRHTWYVTHGTY